MIATVAALAVIGGYALYLALSSASLDNTAASPPVSDSASDAATYSPGGTPPALTIKVTGDFCDVFVGIPQGNVLINERLDHGDLVTFDEPRLSAVVSNGAAVEVTINGELQAPAEPGRRQAFNVQKESAAPENG